jgi:hypothetical protein
LLIGFQIKHALKSYSKPEDSPTKGSSELTESSQAKGSRAKGSRAKGSRAKGSWEKGSSRPCFNEHMYKDAYKYFRISLTDFARLCPSKMEEVQHALWEAGQ